MLKVLEFCKPQGAVENVSFEVMPGEILGLFGARGAGKSTTLRTIAGISRLEHGTIEIAGVDVRSNPVGAKQLVSFFSDRPLFFENMTCWEHVTYVASIYGLARYEKRARALFELFGLTKLTGAFPMELSRGMKHRLALVLALVPSSKILLLDEPFAGLDAQVSRTLIEILRREAARGVAIVISSSYLATLEPVCTSIHTLGASLARPRPTDLFAAA